MNVLVLGSGGREHALAWKLAQSPRLDKLYVAPGNPGCEAVAECVDLDVEHRPADVVRWARDHAVDFVVPGPEVLYCAGIVDRFRDAGIKAFGPTKAAAELEGSKVFAKSLMRRHGIPTADYAVFEQHEAALRYLDTREEDAVVVKADGLAAGKGAIVCQTKDEARAALRRCFVTREFGDAGARVVMEELMRGPEVSVLALTDGRTIAPLASAQDHKAIFDGDAGPNTGGMGAYSPADVLTPKLMDEVVRRILVPTVHAMNDAGRPFKGLLYTGLMLTAGGPRVLEYNIRWGDPETQPLLMRMESDLLSHLEAVVDGRLEDEDIRWRDDAAVCVVLASAGYPGKYERDKPISGLAAAAQLPDTVVFHAGTARNRKGEIVTAGGRVLGVTALGPTVADAIANAYKGVAAVSFEGMQYRTDIGRKALA